MKIGFNTKTTYGDDGDKNIKTRTKTYKNSINTYTIAILLKLIAFCIKS